VAAVRALDEAGQAAAAFPHAPLADTPIASFTYDAAGRRVGATVDGVTTVYPFDHYEVVGATVRKYYSLGGTRVAMRVDGALSYLLTDHLGSTAVTTDAAGAQVGELRYLPYGAPRYAWGVTPTERRFTGQPRYATLGLDYFGARWYDSSLGRWSQPDLVVQASARSAETVLPLAVSYADPRILQQWNEFQRSGRQAGAPSDPQLLNRYTYARNNPLAYRDDTGHWIWLVVGGVGGAIVGLGAYALTHQDNFDWGQAALWAGGGALIGATLGGATELVVGAIGAQAAATTGASAAMAACADGNCLNEAQATQKIIETGWTVIGRYPAYLDKARQLGANALNISLEEWNALGSRAAQWARNVQFLDEAISRGDSFRLATSFAQGWAEKGTLYRQELVYLLQKGYELVVDINGTEWLIKTK